MQIVSKEVSTVHTSVSIEDSEVCWLFPLSYVFRFCEIEDDCDSIFIVLTDWTLVGGGRISADGSMCIF